MFRKVRLRLTFFCALVMGVTLLVMTGFCLALTERGARLRDFSDFQNTAGTVAAAIADQPTLSHTWLSRVEQSCDMIVDILDGGKPLRHGVLHGHDRYAGILDTVRETAADKYGLSAETFRPTQVLTRSASFTFRGEDGRKYYAALALIPKNKTCLDVALVSSTAEAGERMLHQGLLLGGASAAAWLLLSAFAWLFIGRMLRPIEENRQNQARFIASASHELRSPLTVILSCISAARICASEEQPRFFDAAESEGRRMSRLVGDMLSLASSDAQSWSVRPEETEADTLLLEVYEKYEAAAREKEHELTIRLPEETAPLCLCDRERMAQALSILIDNALAHTARGCRVDLSLEICGKMAVFTVADNGGGIPDDQKKKIFERFYRADNARRDKEHFGLGLCIAGEIVRLHRGRISVKDTPGGGASFQIQIPCSGKKNTVF